MRRPRIVFAIVLLVAVCAGGVYAAFQAQTPLAAPLTSYAPPDALLAIESPDFATLLKAWNDSAEQKRWLAGNDYAGFVRSRLFERLGQAQDEFGAVAGLAADTKFLQAIAGGKSLLAWYDIGNLEFLYITRLPSGQAAKTPLLTLRDKFEQRKVGDAVFFVRTEGGKEGSATRTVAFAVRGDYLLLATREDLLANALQLMQKPGGESRTLEHEPWYAGTVAVAGPARGDLRMTLNLAKIVPSPYFRSYWVQQNITEMKQYTAALSDLYRTHEALREERVLLASDPERVGAGADLGPLLAYVPVGIGVYRATAGPSTEDVIAQMEDKLLSRQAGAYRDATAAPVADLSVATTGSSSDFEQRIDEPAAVVSSRTNDTGPLRELLKSTPATAMMVFGSGTPASKDGSPELVFRASHAAVALSFAEPVKVADFERSVSLALAPRLSAGTAGLGWTEHHSAAGTWYTLSGVASTALSCRASVCLAASDEGTLLKLMAAPGNRQTPLPQVATVVAGFRHGAEREPFYALVQVLDHKAAKADAADSTPDKDAVPPFVAGNMVSLSRTFADLDSETFTETSTPEGVTRQTVLYQWRH